MHNIWWNVASIKLIHKFAGETINFLFKVEHSTVKIQSNFTAPQKSGKMSAKRAGVRKTSTDITATHSKKVEEKRKSEEKVSAEKEEQTKLSEKVKKIVCNSLSINLGEYY